MRALKPDFLPDVDSHMTNEQLLQKYYRTGDIRFLGALLERFTVFLLGVCMKYLQDREWAKDVVQQVFLKALTEIGQTRVENPGGWLYTVARNECLTQLRKKRDHLAVGEVPVLPEEESLPLAFYLENERLRAELMTALSKLNTEQRQCIEAFYLERMSYAEVAEKWNMDLKQVKSHIQNGKRNLRNLLEAAGVTGLTGKI